jgi:hypothetical protein
VDTCAHAEKDYTCCISGIFDGNAAGTVSESNIFENGKYNLNLKCIIVASIAYLQYKSTLAVCVATVGLNLGVDL